MASDREYAHYLERDWLVLTCEECYSDLDENFNCPCCNEEDEDE